MGKCGRGSGREGGENSPGSSRGRGRQARFAVGCPGQDRSLPRQAQRLVQIRRLTKRSGREPVSYLARLPGEVRNSSRARISGEGNLRERECAESAPHPNPLGGVDSKDSVLGANQIQSCF